MRLDELVVVTSPDGNELGLRHTVETAELVRARIG